MLFLGNRLEAWIMGSWVSLATPELITLTLRNSELQNHSKSNRLLDSTDLGSVPDASLTDGLPLGNLCMFPGLFPNL